jgi:hypothetical protein
MGTGSVPPWQSESALEEVQRSFSSGTRTAKGNLAARPRWQHVRDCLPHSAPGHADESHCPSREGRSARMMLPCPAAKPSWRRLATEYCPRERLPRRQVHRHLLALRAQARRRRPRLRHDPSRSCINTALLPTSIATFYSTYFLSSRSSPLPRSSRPHLHLAPTSPLNLPFAALDLPLSRIKSSLDSLHAREPEKEA